MVGAFRRAAGRARRSGAGGRRPGGRGGPSRLWQCRVCTSPRTKTAVERADREHGREGVDQLARAAKTRGLEEARPERAPEIVEVAAEHDRRAMV